MSAGEQKLRLFVALPVPAEIKDRLAEIQRELRELLPRPAASWTHPDKMHLTLCFLGNVEPTHVKTLTSSLAAEVGNFGSIKLIAERLGCFPEMRRPRVVWAGVHDDAGRLVELQRCIASATAAFTKEPEETTFTGHITLARTKQIKGPQTAAIAAFIQGATDRRFGEWTATKVELIRSELSASGSHYTCLAEFAL